MRLLVHPDGCSRRKTRSVFPGRPCSERAEEPVSRAQQKPTPRRENGVLPPSGHSQHRAPAPGVLPSRGECLHGRNLPSSGFLRRRHRTKDILILSKCFLSTFSVPDAARNGEHGSEDRRHSRLSAATGSAGLGVSAGFQRGPRSARREEEAPGSRGLEVSAEGSQPPRAFRHPADAGKMQIPSLFSTDSQGCRCYSLVTTP